MKESHFLVNFNPVLPSPNCMSLGKALLISVLQTRKVLPIYPTGMLRGLIC